MKIKKEFGRGGSRKGAGRKSLFKEKTTAFKVTCPVSKVDELKEDINKKLLNWAKKGV